MAEAEEEKGKRAFKVYFAVGNGYNSETVYADEIDGNQAFVRLYDNNGSDQGKTVALFPTVSLCAIYDESAAEQPVAINPAAYTRVAGSTRAR